jgi:hypothetical protein
LSCSEIVADESPIFVQANISRHRYYSEIISNLGEIWIAYTPIRGTIILGSGSERFLIKRVNYYYKEDGNFIFIGSVDEIGVHDMAGNLLRTVPSTVGRRFQVAGISSSIAEHRDLTIRFIIKPDEVIDHYWETEVWEFLDIDIENASIKLRDRSGFVP